MDDFGKFYAVFPINNLYVAIITGGDSGIGRAIALALSLIERGIRVNEVAPGRTWTPLIPASLPPDQYTAFGSDTLLKRAAQPVELAPAYLYLATDDSSYVVGTTIHVNGGEFKGL